MLYYKIYKSKSQTINVLKIDTRHQGYPKNDLFIYLFFTTVPFCITKVIQEFRQELFIYVYTKFYTHIN